MLKLNERENNFFINFSMKIKCDFIINFILRHLIWNLEYSKKRGKIKYIICFIQIISYRKVKVKYYIDEFWVYNKY